MNSSSPADRIPVKRRDGQPNGENVPGYGAAPAALYISCEDVVQPQVLAIHFANSSSRAKHLLLAPLSDFSGVPRVPAA